MVLLASEFAVCQPRQGRTILPGDPRFGQTNVHSHQHDHHHHHHEQQQHNDEQSAQASPYVLNTDGSYSYRYQLSDGTFAFANSDSSGSVVGGYGYKSPDGEDISIEYTAGGNLGFRATGAHLPAAAHSSSSSATSYEADFDDGTASTFNEDEYYDANADRQDHFNAIMYNGNFTVHS